MRVGDDSRRDRGLCVAGGTLIRTMQITLTNLIRKSEQGKQFGFGIESYYRGAAAG
jgi:hypothetical protein